MKSTINPKIVDKYLYFRHMMYSQSNLFTPVPVLSEGKIDFGGFFPVETEIKASYLVQGKVLNVWESLNANRCFKIENDQIVTNVLIKTKDKESSIIQLLVCTVTQIHSYELQKNKFTLEKSEIKAINVGWNMAVKSSLHLPETERVIIGSTSISELHFEEVYGWALISKGAKSQKMT